MKRLFNQNMFMWVVVVASSFTANAQWQGKITADRFIMRATSAAYANGSKGDFEGSPYLNDDFEESRLWGKDAVYQGLLMRYDIHQDRMEFQQNEGLFILEADPRIQKTTIVNTTFVPAQYSFKGKAIQGFLERLDSGKVTLLAKKQISFKERQEPQAMQYAAKPARFERLSDVYFIKNQEGNVTKINSIKKLLEDFPDKKVELKAFVEKEKISMERDDLIKLVSYYNSL
jgi:hypothetical protein